MSAVIRTLGLSFDYHDAAACVLEDDRIVAAAQEERFTRKKHDARLPTHAIEYCLAEAQGRIDAVAFYDKPLSKLHRALETHIAAAPRGMLSFCLSIPPFFRDKLFVEPRIRGVLKSAGVRSETPIYFSSHHLSHAASAFYPSPFESAAVLTVDGVGEWATASIGQGRGDKLEMHSELRFPHSLGLLYSAFTAHCGFRVNNGEYKLMGLAPYGAPRYRDAILSQLMDLKDDGSFRLDQSYFSFHSRRRMTTSKFDALFGGAPRSVDAPITEREIDLARSIQDVTEEVVLRLARHARKSLGHENLCLAGGVALNAVANARLIEEAGFKDIWVQPAAGDAGGALGAAFATAHLSLGVTRGERSTDRMEGGYLGPEFSPRNIRAYLDALNLRYEQHHDDRRWADRIAQLLEQQKIVGVFQGRMELGPRALGNRSIIADPRDPEMAESLNARIKLREGFRPFAPSVMEDRAADYFAIDRPAPYMVRTAAIKKAQRTVDLEAEEPDWLDLEARLARRRSTIGAVTHVDMTARLQTVSEETHPRFYALHQAFLRRTGCPVLLNTSFNRRGEPIVCTPEDAFQCFVETGLDAVTLGPFLVLADG